MRKFLKYCLVVSLAFNQLNILQAQTTVYRGIHADQLIEGAAIVRTTGEEELLSYVAFADGQEPSAEGFLDFFKSQQEIDEAYTFKLIDRQRDALGQEHLRYQQFYQAAPIRMAHLSLHIKNDKVLAVSGFFYKAPFNQAEASIAESIALNRALEAVPAEIYKWEINEEEAFLKSELNDRTATFYPKGTLCYMSENLEKNTSAQRLCYRFDIYAHEPLSRQQVYIDANTAELVFQEDIIKDIDVSAMVSTAYSGNRKITVDSVAANVFRLREVSRGNGVETYNMKGGKKYSNAVDFVDSSNTWTNHSPAIDQYALDAHWGAEMTYDYFLQKHNRNSIDNQGFTLKSYVHYDKNYVNAFWDGQRMTYGDGDNSTTPLTTIDISGHEITHGLTRFTSNLIYAKESGALNESFSDIFGFAIEKFARPNNWNWTIGEDIGRAFRSLSNPKQLNDPDTYGGQNWVSQINCIPNKSNDKCGVHTNSSVQNHWFYLLSQGGSGVNDIGNRIHVDGLGIDTAAAIAFRTNILYLTPASDYKDARFFSFRAAVDLFGACSPAVASTINAWHAVGVGEKYQAGFEADLLAKNDSAFCTSPATVEFFAKGHNIYDFKWDFGDGNTSRLSEPKHSYTNPGNYTVTLYADGKACGKDTLIRQNYIQINSNIQCRLQLDSTVNVTNDCEGRFYDYGGLNGAYPNNRSDTLHILPGTADQIRFEFTHFDVEAGKNGVCNRDYVEIYDGATTMAPSLGRFCNNNLPPDSIMSSTAALTVVFYADAHVSRRGYGAKWECLQATLPPIADFDLAIDTSCDGLVQFYNRSLNGSSQFYWDFGDGNTSRLKDPQHKFLNNGDFTVKLVVENTFGKDSIIKNNVVHIARPLLPEIKDDTVCRNGNAQLSTGVIGSNRWYLNQNDEVPFFKGDTLKLNKIDTTRSFYVENFIEFSTENIVPFSINGDTKYSDTAAALYFDVEKSMLLESVVLYAENAGRKTVEVRNSAGEVMHSKSVYVTASGTQVGLDFVLYPDTGYSISIADRKAALQLNTNGASYPYVVEDLMRITRSSMGDDSFPFFYYWSVKRLSCISERKKIMAYVDTSCVFNSLSELNKTMDVVEVFPNPFTNQFVIKLPKVSDSYSFYLYDSNGRLISKEENRKRQQYHRIETKSLSEGFYFLKIEGQEMTFQKKLIKYTGN